MTIKGIWESVAGVVPAGRRGAWLGLWLLADLAGRGGVLLKKDRNSDRVDTNRWEIAGWPINSALTNRGHGDWAMALEDIDRGNSYNVPMASLDPAMTRPGRLMGAREFPRLSRASALRLAEAKGIHLVPEQADYSLAEIYGRAPLAAKLQKARRLGFA
jgi:hypothetical protein